MISYGIDDTRRSLFHKFHMKWPLVKDPLFIYKHKKDISLKYVYWLLSRNKLENKHSIQTQIIDVLIIKTKVCSLL